MAAERSGKMYDFAVLGGDLRQFYMAKQLAFKGYSVITYGIASGEVQASSMKEAVENAEILVGPIPFPKTVKTWFPWNAVLTSE